MARWYKGFRCVGRPSILVSQLTDKVRQFDLGASIPVVRVEKRARGEFYLFLGIESPNIGEIPEQVQTVIHLLPSLRTHLPGGFQYEEIRSMAGAELDVHLYARHIPYWISSATPEEDPFDTVERQTLGQNLTSSTIAARSQQFNSLLAWLSVTGAGSWDIFKNACYVFDLVREGSSPRHILRRLRLLGHVETSADGMRWSIAPTVLATIPCSADHYHYVLCGQRDAAMLEELRQEAEVEEVPQEGGEGPTTVRISMSEGSNIPGIGTGDSILDGYHYGGEVAHQLAQLLPPFSDWMNTLNVLKNIRPEMHDIKWFNGRSFVDTTFNGASGLYELWSLDERQSATSRPKYTLFYHAETERWLRGEWYGLRYLTLYMSGIECTVRYNHITNHLAIPKHIRWPEVYERALVLASGRLPTTSGPWLRYEGISRVIINELQHKLHLSCEETLANA